MVASPCTSTKTQSSKTKNKSVYASNLSSLSSVLFDWVRLGWRVNIVSNNEEPLWSLDSSFDDVDTRLQS